MMTSRLGVHELLEQHFDTTFAAPDGIKKLRELILTLAMQGKLVEQDPNDPPASELLKAIETEKQRLRTTSSSRRRGSSAAKNLDSRVRGNDDMKTKSLPLIKPEEVPYELPQGWEWVRLGELGITQTGTTPPSKDRENYGDFIPFIGQGDIKNGTINYSGEGLSEQGLSKGRLINANSVLMVCIGGSIGKHAINQINLTCNQQINTLTPYSSIPVKYIYDVMAAVYFQNAVISQAGGSATPIINKQKWSVIPTPLPPLPEQHRIVAKIDQLMAKCDELEKLRKEREEMRLAVHAAAIKQLLDNPPSFPRKRESSRTEGLDHRSPSVQGQAYGEDEKGLEGDGNPASGWDFIQHHFGELYTVKENIAKLRKAILQLAVMGRLVPQDPNDPPTSELLKAIQAEKQQLVKGGKIKQSKPLPPIKPEEVPYELPYEWEWVRLGDIVSILGDGIHGTPSFDESGNYFFINGNNLSDGIIDIKENTKRILLAEYEKHKKELTERTVLVSINGTIGNVALYNNEPVMLGKSACYFNLFKQIEKHYVSKLINSSYFMEYATQSATGSTIKNVSLKTMREFCVPLPPLPEQRRIVAKIDQLMVLCDKLEQQIDAATGKQTDLLNAVVAQV